MSLLSALNDAQRLLSLSVTTAIVNDGQETQNLLFALAKQELRETARAKDWPVLRRTQSFTASLASLQSAPGKPTNFQRAIRGTFWNATTDRQIGGPLTDQEWALVNGEPITLGITQYAMFRYDGLHLYPVPTVAETITYDYIINTPWETSGGSALTTPTADTDVSKLGDEGLTLGVVWRYKQSKGRDYAEDLRSHQMWLEATFEEQAGAAATVSIAPMEYDPVMGPINVPEVGFG